MTATKTRQPRVVTNPQVIAAIAARVAYQRLPWWQRLPWRRPPGYGCGRWGL